MKKILAILLALSLMLLLAACGGDDKETADGDNTSTSQTEGSETTGNSDESTGSSNATDSTETSTPEETTKPTETTKPEHKHSYTSKVTTAATCGKDGVKTFTCSCGDTYTEKIAATGQHSWGGWSIETKAYVGKDGTEKRTCKTCSATETRKTTSGALENSFWPYYGIDGMFRQGESSPINAERIQGYTLLEYIGYGYEGEERDGMDFEISSAGAFAFLDEHFVLTDAQKASMKEDSRYNSATDKFSLAWPGSNLNREIRGYTYNGGNKYTVYYAASNSGGQECTVYWKVELEHNAPNGKPNRYISIVRIASIPANITK